MSLLEEWEAGTVYHEPVNNDDSISLGLDTEAVPQQSASSESIFGIQIVERQISRYTPSQALLANSWSAAPIYPMSMLHRGKGQAAAVSTAEGCATVVTSKAYVIRYDLQQGSTPGQACSRLMLFYIA